MTITKSSTPASGATGRPKARSARRRARELALQGVYAWLIHNDASLAEAGAIDAHIRNSESFAEADAQWYITLLHGTLKQAPELRLKFVPYVDRDINELSPIEHGILLIGSYELVNHIDVPYRVVINEAVELAKSFGGTDGFKFVNGVLDKLAADVRSTEVLAAQR